MTSSNEIKRIYKRLLNKYQKALISEDIFSLFEFPYTINVNLLSPCSSIKELKDEVVNFNYFIESRKLSSIIEYKVRTHNKFGKQTLPCSLTFACFEQITHFLDRSEELSRIRSRAMELQAIFPSLGHWPTEKLELKHVIDTSNEKWQLAISVILNLINRPMHGESQYLRGISGEGISTKFIENNESLIKTLYIADNEHKKRQELRKKTLSELLSLQQYPTQFRIRFLDPSSKEKLGIPFDDFSLRVQDLDKLQSTANLNIFIVENKATYFSFSEYSKGICIFGEGMKASLLAQVKWKLSNNIHYWGDLDPIGLEILDYLLERVPNITPFLMDIDTVLKFQHLGVSAKDQNLKALKNLKAPELQAYQFIVKNKLMLEQEKIPLKDIISEFESIDKRIL